MWCYLLVCLFSQDAEVKTSPLTPRWVVGQETLYRGTVKEDSRGQGIQMQREYQLELRVLVLGIKADRIELACCTKLTQQHAGPGAAPASSVHLTYCDLDRQGKILSTSAAAGPVLSLDGPATWEIGFLVPPPSTTALTPGLRWEVAEPGRLPRRCALSLPEPGQSEDAWVVRSEQESLDWQRPRADSTAWLRTERISYSPRYGLPRQVERLIQRRAPAHQQVTTRLTTTYELVRQDAVAGPMLAERNRDIGELKLYQEEYEGLAARADDPAARAALRRLGARLVRYKESPGRTPYREAVATLQSQVQAASAGRPLVQPSAATRSAPVKEGEFAPNFQLVSTEGTTVTLKEFRGRPCLLLFVTPGTSLTRTVAAELAPLQARFGAKTFACLVLAGSERAEMLPPPPNTLWKNLDGRGESAGYGIKETPAFVLLDVDGSVQRCLIGWGPETRQAIEKWAGKELGRAQR